MAKIDVEAVAKAAGKRTRWVWPELDLADLQVAEARARVDRLSAAIEQDMRRAGSTPEARELLTACRRILREMVAHRDAVFGEFLKASPSRGTRGRMPNTTAEEREGTGPTGKNVRRDSVSETAPRE